MDRWTPEAIAALLTAGAAFLTALAAFWRTVTNRMATAAAQKTADDGKAAAEIIADQQDRHFSAIVALAAATGEQKSVAKPLELDYPPSAPAPGLLDKKPTGPFYCT